MAVSRNVHLAAGLNAIKRNRWRWAINTGLCTSSVWNDVYAHVAAAQKESPVGIHISGNVHRNGSLNVMIITYTCC